MDKPSRKYSESNEEGKDRKVLLKFTDKNIIGIAFRKAKYMLSRMILDRL